MEDFDEAEEMNEEDLLELGDPFGSLDLKVTLTTLSLDACIGMPARIHADRQTGSRLHCLLHKAAEPRRPGTGKEVPYNETSMSRVR